VAVGSIAVSSYIFLLNIFIYVHHTNISMFAELAKKMHPFLNFITISLSNIKQFLPCLVNVYCRKSVTGYWRIL